MFLLACVILFPLGGEQSASGGGMHPGGSASGGGGLASRGRGVCIQGEGSASRGRGVCIKVRKSASRGSASWGIGVCIQGEGSASGWGGGQTPELEKRAIHILLECFLDTLIFLYDWQFGRSLERQHTRVLPNRVMFHRVMNVLKYYRMGPYH